MNNIKPCKHCNTETTFERDWIEQPQEGESCLICGAWVCNDCVNWVKSDPDPVCKKCVGA